MVKRFKQTGGGVPAKDQYDFGGLITLYRFIWRIAIGYPIEVTLKLFLYNFIVFKTYSTFSRWSSDILNKSQKDGIRGIESLLMFGSFTSKFSAKLNDISKGFKMG